jgi:cellulose biosynthesis protein BcsQ
MHILATFSIKGGVGKTSAAVNLARMCAAEGRRTLLWDLDPQGGASYMLRVKPRAKGGPEGLLARKKRGVARLVRNTAHELLDVLPADFENHRLERLIAEQKKPTKALWRVLRPLWDAQAYDMVLLDCAPSLSLVGESVFYFASALLVPMQPSPLALRAYGQLKRFLREEGLDHIELLPFFCMFDRRRKLHREALEVLERDRAVLRSVIPDSAEVERMSAERAPLLDFAPEGRAAEQFRALWSEIALRLG